MEDSIFVKIIVVGDSGVGKTSLLNRYCYDLFDTQTQITIGCDFTSKIITNFNGKTIKFQFWDIAGYFNFEVITKTTSNHNLKRIFALEFFKRVFFILFS